MKTNMKSKAELMQIAQSIRLAVFDVDGVLTDGRLYFGSQGEALKAFHVHDGLGVKLLKEQGIEVAIISSRSSEIVSYRLRELGVEYIFQGCANKLNTLNELMQRLKLNYQEIAYVGDDLPDLPIIKKVGIGIAVANAHPFVKQHAAWETVQRGGEGAVREVCELILDGQGKLEKVFSREN